MARKKIQYYVFTPGAGGAGTVKFQDPYGLHDILMITNVTRNTVIYNFGDPNRGGTLSYSSTDTTTFPGAQQGVTTLTLTYNTLSPVNMTGDVLQIFVETTEQRVRTHDFGIDAVERQRIAIPRSLIDADFEYGLQNTKWASVSAYRNIPTFYEIPGSPINANVTNYATILTSGANTTISGGNIHPATVTTGGAAVTINAANQGTDYLITGPAGLSAGAGTTYAYAGPRHHNNDYKMIIAQGLAGEATCPQSGAPNVQAGGSTIITLPQPITLANGGIYQRSFTVANTTGFFPDDIIAVASLPDGVGYAARVITNVTGALDKSLSANAVIAANSVIAVETIGTQAGAAGYNWELMAVHTSTSTAGGTDLGVTRHLWGTNPGNAHIAIGAKIMYLSGNTTAQLANSAIEIMRIDSIAPATNTLHVTRSWFNTNANAQFNTNSIVSLVNLRGNLTANIEIVKNSQSSQINNVPTPQTILRQFTSPMGRAFGTSPISSAPAGSHYITLTGVTVVGNVNMPAVLINANSHQVPAGTLANGNAYVSTIGLNSANVEGVYKNLLADVNYLGYYAKVNSNLPIGYPLNNNDQTAEVRRGGVYTGGNIKFKAITSNAGTPSLITVSTINPHGLLPGVVLETLLVGGVNASTHGSGIFVVETVPTSTSFTYVSKPGASVPNTITNGNLTVFSTSLVRHRPFDGGTNIGTNIPSHGYETARQTKKYFRYQSGKGMMFTTGTQFNPVFTIANITATGTAAGQTMFIVTDGEHGLQAGANVSIYNIATAGYNGFYRVAGVTSPITFTVNVSATLGATMPTFLGNTGSTTPPRIAVRNWMGARIRNGMFDGGNGVFWEYDGQYLWAVKRSVTNNLAGKVSVARDDNRLTGDGNTRFVDQLRAGDDMYIKGMVYTCVEVQDQNTIFISPAFKGVINGIDAQISVIREVRTRQANFNQDRLDGTGPSGYIVDLSKMQMVAIQYTWYGAGFIDWGMRTTDGKMIWAHRLKNNNVNDEGYMRSGNLPARYQATNRGAVGQVKTAIVAGATEIQLYDVSEFPGSTIANAIYPGHVVIDQEIISFTGINTSTGNLTGCTRGATYRSWILGSNRAMTMGSATTHAVNASVILFSTTCAPDLNHWGSAVILDGDFDVDRTYQFNYQVTNIQIGNQTEPYTLFMMRLAPSISAGLTGDLGVKDIINRAQLLLQNCYISLSSVNARCLLQGIVNPENIRSANWQRLNQPVSFNQPSFTQFVANTGLGTVNQNIIFGNIRSPQGVADRVTPYATGGEQLFSIPIAGVSAGFVDLSKVKEIGGAILPGYGTFPNGPEVVAFNIQPIGTFSAQVDLQVTFLESQA